MGSSYWSNDYYEDRAAARKAANAPVFAHTKDVLAGRATAIHDALDPAKMKDGRREARDSKEHPDSVPIIFALDVTGSMQSVPVNVHAQLPKLMSTILTNGYVKDPQVLFAAIGDAYSDHAPLQVGQFESGIEMEDDISRFYLEGNGGGQNTESYELAFYFAARRTSTDAWEKRQRKGYLFMTGDEHPYPAASREIINRVFGTSEEADIPVETLVKECQERYHVFFLIPGNSSHGRDPALRSRWTQLLGAEHIIDMQDESRVCDIVARKIGEVEGTLLPDATTTSDKKGTAKTASADPSAVDKAKKAGHKTARL
jgi:hypothetical protein